MDKQIFRGARELAAYTGFSENAVHILVARGALPVHRHGRLLIFLKDEIDEFFARLPGTTAADALAAATCRHDTTGQGSGIKRGRAERLGPLTDEVSRPHRN
jgi:hypothetical protein